MRGLAVELADAYLTTAGLSRTTRLLLRSASRGDPRARETLARDVEASVRAALSRLHVAIEHIDVARISRLVVDLLMTPTPRIERPAPP
jgi:hypothetical protein